MIAKACLCSSVAQTRQVWAKLLTTLPPPGIVREKERKLFPFNEDPYPCRSAAVPSTQPECNSLTQSKPESIDLALEGWILCKENLWSCRVAVQTSSSLKHLLVICLERGLDSLVHGNPQQFVMGPK